MQRRFGWLNWLVFGIALTGTGCGPVATETGFVPIDAEPVLEQRASSANLFSKEEPIPEPVIASVNGDPISAADYRRAEKQLNAATGGTAILSDQVYQETVLDALINQTVLAQAAQTQGVDVSDYTVTQAIVELKNETLGETYNTWLELNHLTEAELHEILRAELTSAALFAEVAAEMPMSVEQVHARHILLPDLAQAEDVLVRLEAGEAFSVVAQEVSLDTATRNYGGDLGWFPQGVGVLPPKVEFVAFALDAGELSPVIESEAGFHIAKVELRDENRPLTPEYRLKLQAIWFESWLGEQRASAQIEHYAN